MKHKRLSDILENCLDQIFNDNDLVDGQKRIDLILAQYSEFEDQLRPELEIAMWFHEHRRVVELRPGYLTASRQRLVDHIKGEEQKHLTRQKSELTWTRSVLRLAIVILVLMVAFFSYYEGTRAVHVSLPGDQLYDLKLAVEDIQLSMASDSVEEADIRIELTDKRAGEVVKLLEFGRYDDAGLALNGYRVNISIAGDLISKLPDDSTGKDALAQKLGIAIRMHNENFSAAIVTGGIPNNILATLSSTVALNKEVTLPMVMFMEEYEEIFLPLQASVVPKTLLTSTYTSTFQLTSTPYQVLTETAEPSETPEPYDTSKPGKTPVLSDTPIILDPVDDRYDDDEDSKLKPTKKPTKTPKDKDKDKNKDKNKK